MASKALQVFLRKNDDRTEDIWASMGLGAGLAELFHLSCILTRWKENIPLATQIGGHSDVAGKQRAPLRRSCWVILAVKLDIVGRGWKWSAHKHFKKSALYWIDTDSHLSIALRKLRPTSD